MGGRWWGEDVVVKLKGLVVLEQGAPGVDGTVNYRRSRRGRKNEVELSTALNGQTDIKQWIHELFIIIVYVCICYSIQKNH